MWLSHGIIFGDHVNIECNECGAVVRTLEPSDLSRIVDEVELTLPLLDNPDSSFTMRTASKPNVTNCSGRTCLLGLDS